MIKHLEDTGFTYCQHFRIAASFAFFCFVGSLRAGIHAIYPNWFTDTTHWVGRKIRDTIT